MEKTNLNFRHGPRKFLTLPLLFMLVGLGISPQKAWAFTTDGSTYVEFVNGDVITFDFSAVTCTDAGVDRVGISLQKVGSSPYQSATLTFNGTKRCTTSQDRLQVHWQSGGSWQHNGKEWTEIGSTNFPFPTSSSQTTIKVTLDGSGNAIYTWSGGGGGGSCTNCGTVNK